MDRESNQVFQARPLARKGCSPALHQARKDCWKDTRMHPAQDAAYEPMPEPAPGMGRPVDSQARQSCWEGSHYGCAAAAERAERVHVCIRSAGSRGAAEVPCHSGWEGSHRRTPRCWTTRPTWSVLTPRDDVVARAGDAKMCAAAAPPCLAPALGLDEGGDERSAAGWVQAAPPWCGGVTASASRGKPSRRARCRRRSRLSQSSPRSRWSWRSCDRRSKRESVRSRCVRSDSFVRGR